MSETDQLEFTRAYDFTARHEGGYVNHPADPGGETNLGVTASVWAAWCRSQSLPRKAMRELTHEDVRPLYYARYWQPLPATLPWPLNAALYDMAVNHGVGDGNPDGRGDGGATYLLAQAYRRAGKGATPRQLAEAAIDAREAFFHAIVANRPASRVFLRGWLNRVAAQREWLRTQPDTLTPATPAVFITDQSGKRSRWDGQPVTYGGKFLDAAFVDRLIKIYPRGTDAARHGDLLVTVAADGAVILNRA